MKITIELNPDLCTLSQDHISNVLAAFKRALDPKPEQRPLPKTPATVEETPLEHRALAAAGAVLQEYRKVGEDPYFLASHLMRVILPFFSDSDA